MKTVLFVHNWRLMITLLNLHMSYSTNMANELFLNSVQGGLEMFIQEQSHRPTFPN
jgi:hypothetical protein